MSKHLVRNWRRVARQWQDVADARREREALQPSTDLIRAEAYACVFTECADSLERSLALQLGKVHRGARR